MRSPIVPIAAAVLWAAPLWAAPPQQVLGPRTVVPALVLCTDQPVTTSPVPTLIVAAGHTTDGRQSLVEGETLVVTAPPTVTGAAQPQLAVGQRFVVRRLQGGANAFSQNVNGLGAIRTAGWITVTAVDGPIALARIDFSCDAIQPGDYLEAFVELPLPSTADDLGDPQFSDRAQVLFGADHRENLGDGDVFSLDRGTTQGVTVGARFAIYRDPKDGMPLVHVGDAVVIDPSATTSRAVLVMVKDAVLAGDVAVRRRAP